MQIDMRFVADESVDAPIVQKLRENGYEIFSIAEQSPGVSDEEVLAIACQKKITLVTQDKDFGELIYRLGKTHEGVVLLRLGGLNPYQKAELALNVMSQHKDKLPGAFTVIYKEIIKIRKGQ